MYYYFNGPIVQLTPDYAVVECGGIGYYLTISRYTYENLVAGGAINPAGESTGLAVKLFSHYLVREDAAELYGFSSEEERGIFRQLLSVSGVGPKAAISILSALPWNDLVRAVWNDDARAITGAQGVGLKTAQKIILELRDKVTKGALMADSAAPLSTSPAVMQGAGMPSEAVNALCVLGYTRVQAQRAVAKVTGETVEQLIYNALKTLGNP